MAKRAFTTLGVTFAATAAGAAITNGNFYMALKAASATQLVDILEVKVDGSSTSSAVFGGILDRVTTNETGAQTALTGTTGADGPLHPATAALAAPVQTFIQAATTQPTPSGALGDARLSFTINSFGGTVRWNAAPTQQFSFFGTATPFQEAVLYNSSTASGSSTTVNAHIIYEPY